MAFLLPVPILLPIVAGLVLLRLNFRDSEDRSKRERFVTFFVAMNALLTFLTIKAAGGQKLTLFSINDAIQFVLRVDGFGAIFAVLVSVLWILASFYAFEYMKHEGTESRFLAFYTLTLGVTVGIAFSANLATLYLFYELLTLATLPLVCHSSTPQARTAGRIYLLYSLGGAAFGFVALAMVAHFGGTTDFVAGGVMQGVPASAAAPLLVFYVVGFMGFGVKSAVFPFHSWLPVASVAPTPVTALLHAVAVVKAGVFAVGRLTYFNMGLDFLSGTKAQHVVMAIAIATILYGSTMAAFTRHLKRRLAYSTVSQLSYILLSLTMMSEAGFAGGMFHLVAHAVAKITLFYCAGAILYKTHKEYVWELRGIGRRMPITMTAFLLASLSLAGVPPFTGFFSKWNLILACTGEGSALGMCGAVALVISAFLTAVYLFSVCVTAFVSPNDERIPTDHDADPNAYMTVPLVILSVVTVLFGLACGTPFVNFARSLVGA